MRTSPPEIDLAPDTRTQWVGAASILFATAHRPWPAPMAPWVMTQRMNDLLFLHYALAPEAVRVLVPDVLTLDTYGQQAWVTVAALWINHLRPPGVPSLPWVSQLSQINVRTYVTFGGKPGVYFFSVDASKLPSIWGARMFYRLPYWQASIKVRGKGGAEIEYTSKRQHGPKPAEFRCVYGPASDASFHARPGSLEHFLAERYCLYSVSRKRLYRAEIHHLPWELQDAAIDLRENTIATTAGVELPPQPEMALFARELKVLFWAPERLL